jgi:signal transduction histidine kinase/ligand-binding sensor domain-containing protein
MHRWWSQKKSSVLQSAVAALFLWLPHLALGQVNDFSITNWDTRDGLPEIKVQALAVQPEKGVWVATEGGLCLFDGTNCNSLPQEEVRRFPQNSFIALLVARDQSLWAGTEGGGLLHISHGRVESFARKEGLTDGYVRIIYEDSANRIWVGTDYGLFRKSGSNFQHVPLGKIDVPQFVNGIVEDTNHRLIVGGKSLSIVDGNAVNSLSPWKDSGQPQIKSLLYTRGGRLIVGTVDGSFVMDGQHFRRMPFPRVDIESLCELSDGAIWAGTVSAGLWQLKSGVASRVAFGEKGMARTVLAMTTDPRGRLWVGTQNGLARIEETSVHFFKSPALAVDRETLATSPTGAVNLVNGNVYRIDNKGLHQLSFPIPNGTRILDILYAKDHSVWLGAGGRGVYRIDANNRVTLYSTQSHPKISTDYPRGIVEGKNGDIWIATEFGVNVIRHGAVELLSVANNLPSRAVRTLYLDREGCMWIGTDGGPAVSCNGILTQNRATRELAGEETWSIVEDSGGTMWFGTRRNGLYAFTETGSRHFSVANGLPSNDICGLTVDGDGNLWVSSLDRIFSIPSAHTIAVGRDSGFVIPRSFTLPSGVEGLRFTRGRFPGALLDADGSVWFATDQGAAMIDERLSSTAEIKDKPTPVIQSIAVDNSILAVAPSIQTRPNPHRIVIQFGAAYLGPEQDAVLMYRLKGVDDGWSISSGSKQAIYNNLPAGSYWFELKACDRASPDVWKTTQQLIVIPVSWYRSSWFYALAALSILGLILLGYFLYLQRVRYGFRLILEERTRLAREMHDTLIQGCNGVAMLLDAEAGKQERDGECGLLSVASAQLRATVSDARNALWNLRKTEADSNYLCDTLKSIATYANTYFGIPVDLKLPQRRLAISSSSAHELMMIVREAVTNAGTHGSPTKIIISAKVTSKRVAIEVIDNGSGFDVDVASLPKTDHYGIRGMRERAATVGASFQITSKLGSGTVVSVSLST